MKKSCGECVDIGKVTYLQKANEQLKEENYKLRTQIKKYKYDSMTGLLGRADFNEDFDNLWYEHENFGNNFILVIIDLNGLHSINRDHGFSAGDKFIIDTADVIKSLFGDAAAYRTSGDEFFLLKRGADCTTLQDRLEAIPNCEYFGVESKEDFETATDMFNYCDNEVINKKEQNKTKRDS